MQQVCLNWLTQTVHTWGTWAGETNPSITDVHEIKSGDILLAHCYLINPRGYVIVPTLKELPPVKLYSDEADFDVNTTGGINQLIKDVLKKKYELYLNKFGSLGTINPQLDGKPFAQTFRTEWDRLTVSSGTFTATLASKKSGTPQDYGPLLSCSWGQGWPYWNYCPVIEDDTCYLGCTAAAAAQLLKYWEWPQSGVGSCSYYWYYYRGNDRIFGGQLTADFSDPYDWENMMDSCDGETCTALNQDAVAELCYETAVAFSTGFGTSGSSALAQWILYAFPHYFTYSPTIEMHQRADYSLENWFNLVQQEINLNRPIFYAIYGHMVVCDGYRISGPDYEYHMNYGWTGSHTAWYILDSLYCYWVEPDSLCPPLTDFMFTGIHPQTNPLISLCGYSITDTLWGNGNGVVEAGERIELSLTLHNIGASHPYAFDVNLYDTEPHVDIINPMVTLPSIAAGETVSLPVNIEFQVHVNCPEPYMALFQVYYLGDFPNRDTFYIPIGNSPGFSDTLENDEGYWTHRPTEENLLEAWHLDSTRYQGGAPSWKMGEYGVEPYRDFYDAALITPPVLLPGNARLKFWHWMDAELGQFYDPGMARDGGVVMISEDDCAWTQIEPIGGYPYQISALYDNRLADSTPCFSGSHDWHREAFDLSDYSGYVRIMFRFVSDGASFYGTNEGWYVDDIEIVSGSCCQGQTGNVDCSSEDQPDISDITRLIDYLYLSHAALCCLPEADVDKSGGEPDISDITFLIDHLYLSHKVLPDCP
ncbi:MAG: C10 family peptidase [candidate division Zixibacteria bacterium]|nr:C10 family peptidase [candidate division Zixibacteria bacterium]